MKDVILSKKHGDGVLIEDVSWIPVVLDLECLRVRDDVLLVFGFLLPEESVYYGFSCSSQNQNFALEVKAFLVSLIETFVWNKTNWSNVLLIGHNILGFDLLVLGGFLKNGDAQSAKRLCDSIIDGKNTRTKEMTEAKSESKLLKSKMAILDTLIAQQEAKTEKTNNLFAFKTELFLTQKSTIPPLEFCYYWQDFKLREVFDYNCNDTIYTYLVFTNYNGRGFMQTRRKLCEMFVKERNLANKQIPITQFYQALSITESQLITGFFGDMTDQKPPSFQTQPLSGEDIIYLNENYAFINEHKYNMQQTKGGFINLGGLNKEKLKPYKILDTECNPGLGGLHSIRTEVKKTEAKEEKLGFFGKVLTLAFSDENVVILNLDFRSYYIALLINLWQKRNPNSPLGGLLKRFNDVRLKLKEEKNPLDSIYKTATLSNPGNLNSNLSSVYDPQLYYSMTQNGQLLILELLNDLKAMVLKILDCNTDGICVVITHENLTKVMGVCDEFENQHNLKIDTRETIDYGLFFGSNKKIYRVQGSKKATVKGFPNLFGFSCIQNTITTWLDKRRFQFNHLDEFYTSLWECFKEQTCGGNFINFIDVDKNVKGHFLFYCPSKNPTFHFGYLKASESLCQVRAQPVCTKLFYFQNQEVLTGETIYNDLDFSAYWDLFCKTIFEGSYIRFLNQEFKADGKCRALTLENSFFFLNNDMVPYYKTSPFYEALNYFASLNLFAYFKRRNKMSFVKKFNFEKSRDVFLNQRQVNKMTYGEFMLRTYPFCFRNAASLCVKLDKLWEHAGILCFDFDNVSCLFQKRNEEIYNLFLFLCDAKREGLVIFSSPTNSPFDRFKVFVEISDAPNMPYKAIEKMFREKTGFRYFQIEQFAGVFGDNTDGQSLIHTKPKSHITLTYAELCCFPEKYAPKFSEKKKLSTKELVHLILFFLRKEVPYNGFVTILSTKIKKIILIGSIIMKTCHLLC
jgi:hypothetical protein